MGLRPGHCYSKSVNKRAYTRVAKKVHSKNYVGGVPGIRIRQFHMGFGGKDYSHVVHFCTKEKIQIRDNALEATRITIVRQLNKELTNQNYYMKLRVYPQFFLRENKQAQGAHADRIQQGMSQCPFGNVVGRASRVRPGQKIFSILVNKEHIPVVRHILKRAKAKLPCKMTVEVYENKDTIKSIGTIKKKLQREITQVEKEEAEEAAEEEAKEAAEAEEGKEGKPKEEKDSKEDKGKEKEGKPKEKSKEKK